MWHNWHTHGYNDLRLQYVNCEEQLYISSRDFKIVALYDWYKYMLPTTQLLALGFQRKSRVVLYLTLLILNYLFTMTGFLEIWRLFTLLIDFNIMFNAIFPSRSRSPKWSLLLRFLTKILHKLLPGNLWGLYGPPIQPSSYW